MIRKDFLFNYHLLRSCLLESPTYHRLERIYADPEWQACGHPPHTERRHRRKASRLEDTFCTMMNKLIIARKEVLQGLPDGILRWNNSLIETRIDMAKVKILPAYRRDVGGEAEGEAPKKKVAAYCRASA